MGREGEIIRILEKGRDRVSVRKGGAGRKLCVCSFYGSLLALSMCMSFAGRWENWALRTLWCPTGSSNSTETHWPLAQVPLLCLTTVTLMKARKEPRTLAFLSLAAQYTKSPEPTIHTHHPGASRLEFNNEQYPTPVPFPLCCHGLFRCDVTLSPTRGGKDLSLSFQRYVCNCLPANTEVFCLYQSELELVKGPS